MGSSAFSYGSGEETPEYAVVVAACLSRFPRLSIHITATPHIASTARPPTTLPAIIPVLFEPLLGLLFGVSFGGCEVWGRLVVVELDTDWLDEVEVDLVVMTAADCKLVVQDLL